MFSRINFILLFIISVTVFIIDIHSIPIDVDDDLEVQDEVFRRDWLENLEQLLDKRRVQTVPHDTKTRKKIQRIIAKWNLTEIRNGVGIGSLVANALPEDRSARIDNQSPITKDGIRYYNVQVQLGSNTYSTVFIPAAVKIPVRKIRNAFVESMKSGHPWIFKKPTKKGQPWKAIDETHG
jgi:hypothetical protein